MSLECVDVMKKAGIRFVPMPVLDAQDYAELITDMMQRLDKLEAQAKADEQTS